MKIRTFVWIALGFTTLAFITVGFHRNAELLNTPFRVSETSNPPVFVAIAPLRADAPNGVDYKPDENVEPTKQAYPDLAPLITDVPPRDMFARAEKVARDMGWEIVAAEADEGRLEATDTTLWFGFKDDIVVRVVAEGQGSRLDVRSMSRVGKSDLGKNADRIRKFLAAVQEAS